MNGMTLRKTVEAASARHMDSSFWNSAGKRAIEVAGSLKYWDAIRICQAFAAAEQNHQEGVFVAISEAIRQQISSLAPKHVLDTLAAFETVGMRPKQLYVELFNAMLKLTPAMYGEEMAQTASTMARLNVSNPQLLSRVKAGIMENQRQLKFLHLCQIAGSFASLSCLDDDFLTSLERSAKKEIDLMTPDEVFDSLKGLRFLQFSWKPFESHFLECGLGSFIDSVTNHKVIDELSSPVSFFLFLKRHNMLSNKVLVAYSNWLKEAALRPNTRIGRRPSSEDVFLISDHSWEYQAGEVACLEAISIFRREGPVPLKPLRYARKRGYINAEDPLTSSNVAPARWPVGRVSGSANFKVSPGKSPRKNERPVWLNFNLPWYYNR